jgi:outer membrane protein assembly factor BamB
VERSAPRPGVPRRRAVTAGGQRHRLYVGANNGFLYTLDRATGAQVSSFEIGTWVASGPAISGNALVAGAWDGNLYAFAGR